MHLNEIARLAATLNNELVRLQAAGRLDCTRTGNQLQYSTHRGHPIYSELVGILCKAVGLANVLIEALALLADRIDAAFGFSSGARGTATTGSGVDLLLVGSVDFGVVIDAPHRVQKHLDPEVNAKSVSARDWRARRKARAIRHRALAQPNIFLIGTEHEFAGPGRRKP